MDFHDRTYAYSFGIATNGGAPQPVYFALEEDLLLTDDHGSERTVRILDVAGRSALIEYRPLDG